MPTLSTGDCVLTLDHKPWAAGPVAAAECQSIPYRLRRHILYPQGRKEEGTVVPPILLPGTFVKEEGVRFRPDASRRRIRQGRGRRHYGFTSRRRRLGGNKESEYTSLQDWNAQSLPVACDRWPGLPCGPPIGGRPGVKPLWKGGLLLVEPAGDGNTLSRGRRQHLVG